MSDQAPAPADMQKAIEGLLAALKDLLAQVGKLRQQAGELETTLAQAQNEYDQKLKALNQAYGDLEMRRQDLESRLAGKSPPKKRDEAGPYHPPPPPPPPPPPGGFMPEPPPEPPQRQRKRGLAQLVYSLTDDEAIIRQINAVVDDDRRDEGDLLEILPWGPVWQERSDWDTPEDHYRRLTRWQKILQERLIHWQERLHSLQEEDERYPLMSEREQLGPQGWQALLEQMATDQAAENARLKTVVDDLEARWQSRQASGAGSGE